MSGPDASVHHGVPESAIHLDAADHANFSCEAIVSWDDGVWLENVAFDLRWRSLDNTALFKIRVSLPPQDGSSSRDRLFLLLTPERIRRLVCHDWIDIERKPVPFASASAGADRARVKFGPCISCLEFSLRDQADLVGPQAFPLNPQDPLVRQTLGTMQTLAAQRTIFVLFPQKELSTARLAALSRAVSAGSLHTDARLVTLSTLYQGQGARIIEVPDVEAEPPAYADAAAAPEPPSQYDAADATTRKRKRARSLDHKTRRGDPPDAEAARQAMMDVFRAEMTKIMEVQYEKLYERLMGDLRPMVTKEVSLSETRVLDIMEQRITAQVSRDYEEMEEMQERLERQAERYRDDAERLVQDEIAAVDDRVEDEFFGMRRKLEEFVKEEVSNAQLQVIERLQTAFAD